MMECLRAALKAPKRLPASAVSLAAAALDAGVTTTTLLRWVEAGEVDRIKTTRG
ncbi:MAG: hypothetical protein KGL68_09160 [Burkholderiales bacterium]|nr:hypothetical protein [Burkholderiales bacterium]